jgi:hypothetical protein
MAISRRDLFKRSAAAAFFGRLLGKELPAVAQDFAQNVAQPVLEISNTRVYVPTISSLCCSSYYVQPFYVAEAAAVHRDTHPPPYGGAARASFDDETSHRS